MKVIRTVLGDIDPSQLGFTAAHEHVFMDPTGHGKPDNDWSLYDWDKQLRALREFKAVGGEAIIDATSGTNLGRDAARLYTASLQSGVKIVASTGLVLITNPITKEFMASMEKEMTPTQLTDYYVKQVEEGMDGTDIKAGWYKGGSDYCHIQPLQEKALRALVRASKITGAPVHCHTDTGTFALEQVAIAKSEGMDITNYCVAHIDRNMDYWVHKNVLDQGCYIIYDGIGKVKYYPDALRVDFLRRLVEEGYGKQIMLSMDMGKRSSHKVYGFGPGWGYIKTTFIPRLLDEGFSQETIDDFTIHNPANFYSLKK